MCLIEFKRAQETRVSRRQKPYSVYCKRELRIGPEGEEATLQKLRAWLLAAPSFKSGAEHRQHHPNDIADKAPAFKGGSQGKKQSSSSSSSSSSSDSSSSSSSSRNSSPQKKENLKQQEDKRGCLLSKCTYQLQDVATPYSSNMFSAAVSQLVNYSILQYSFSLASRRGQFLLWLRFYLTATASLQPWVARWRLWLQSSLVPDCQFCM